MLQFTSAVLGARSKNVLYIAKLHMTVDLTDSAAGPAKNPKQSRFILAHLSPGTELQLVPLYTAITFEFHS